MRGSREKIRIRSGHSFRILRWKNSLRDAECFLEPGKTERITGEGTHWHFHSEMELTLFTSGEGTRFVGDHIESFTAGDLVLLGEKLPHYWHTRGGSSGLSVQWHFPESHPFWAFPENFGLTKLFHRASRGLRIMGRTADDAAAFMHKLTRSQGADRLATLLHLLARLAAAPSDDRNLLSVRSFALSAELHYQQTISRAVRYLLANFRDEVRLKDLLRITGLSRPTFARQFKKHSGHTFSQFLNRLRLQAACHELRESKRGILDIALASGFTEVSFFNRLFRRQMKCNPTEFRSKSRKHPRQAKFRAA